MNNPAIPLVELLYRALSSPHGVVVSTNDVTRLREKFYAVRREAQNPDFEALTFAPSRANPETELWLVRKPNGQPKV